MAGKNIIEISDSTFEQEVLQAEVPVLVDFWAPWCGPCKMVAPVLEELARDFEGKLDIFKVNTEEEMELAAVFGVRNIPSILFVPASGQPHMAMGALPKETFIKAFKEVLGVEI